jgi:hypothetical protein
MSNQYLHRHEDDESSDIRLIKFQYNCDLSPGKSKLRIKEFFSATNIS